MTDCCLRRHLHIPLVSAERAWAHAMELKKDTEDKVDARKRHHSVRRFAKASYWAAELSRFASHCCDTRGALEAEAYASWMAGNVLLEKETDWEKALAHYARAKYVSARPVPTVVCCGRAADAEGVLMSKLMAAISCSMACDYVLTASLNA